MGTEKSDVYSISGMFAEQGQAKFFGGFFSVRTSPDEPRQSVLAMPFSGLLVDCYGRSKIDGELSSQELGFDKIYFHGTEIRYNFRRNDKGIWLGEYSIKNSTKKGRACAKTNLDWMDFNMVVPEHFDPEGWTKALLEQMVDEGRLEIVRDEQTGEEVVLSK